MLKKTIILSLCAIVLALASAWASEQSHPKLMVNIIVGGMREGDIQRYRSTFGAGGFLRLWHSGVRFSQAHYSSSQTVTSSSLATLTTGATPSVHGVVGDAWWENILGERVSLVHDPEARGVEYNLRKYNYSAHRLIAPTISQRLLYEKKGARSVSISIDPLPAIVMSGGAGDAYWIDELSCEWGSSSPFMATLPDWVIKYNKSPQIATIANEKWVSRLQQNFYVNTHATKLKARSATRRYEADSPSRARGVIEQRQRRYEQIQFTPAGNRAIFDFARHVIERDSLGRDNTPDILNIYLDPARNIARRYGVESVEVEDMYCHLDAEIDSFIKSLTEKIKLGDIVITLTSDHGMSPAYGGGAEPKGRFDAAQFKVVTNSFLRARYGGENWILGYENRNIYLNHKEIYRNKLSLEEVQNEVASFALQFRGISHALTATALRSGSFATGYGEKMQYGFYPRRSGDVVLNFMPGWIEQQDGVCANAGSTYRYDSHVPLIIYGEGHFIGHEIERGVTLESLAPTLAYILGVSSPDATEREGIAEILELFKKE